MSLPAISLICIEEPGKGSLLASVLRLTPSYLRLLISEHGTPSTSVRPERRPYDGRAVGSVSATSSTPARLPTVLVVGLSALFLAAVIVATAVLGLGLRTTYGSGIDSRLGSQLQLDFLFDQDAEAGALSKGDPSLLSGRLTGNALQDVSQRISATSGSPPTRSFQAGSLNILKAQNPIDPTLVIQVQVDGTETATSSAGAAPTPPSRKRLG